jgi:hypothetical protein
MNFTFPSQVQNARRLLNLRFTGWNAVIGNRAGLGPLLKRQDAVPDPRAAAEPPAGRPSSMPPRLNVEVERHSALAARSSGFLSVAL